MMGMNNRTASSISHALADARGASPVQRSDGSWMTHCPNHDDRSPSLTVIDTERGPVARCHAGCGDVDLSDVRIPQDA